MYSQCLKVISMLCSHQWNVGHSCQNVGSDIHLHMCSTSHAIKAIQFRVKTAVIPNFTSTTNWQAFVVTICKVLDDIILIKRHIQPNFTMGISTFIFCPFHKCSHTNTPSFYHALKEECNLWPPFPSLAGKSGKTDDSFHASQSVLPGLDKFRLVCMCNEVSVCGMITVSNCTPQKTIIVVFVVSADKNIARIGLKTDNLMTLEIIGLLDQEHFKVQIWHIGWEHYHPMRHQNTLMPWLLQVAGK